MVNYDLKAEVIASGLVAEYKRVRGAFFRELFPNEERKEYPGQLDYETAKYEAEFFLENNPEEWNEARRCADNDRARTNRLRNRIIGLLKSGECLFLTLTFTDDTLNKTSRQTRRKYVTLYLKSQCDKYVANVDYGAKNGREHYHAIVFAPKINYSEWHKYGAIKGKVIKSNSEPKKLANYINKLTNHAIKETCKRNAIIYSRHIFVDDKKGFYQLRDDDPFNFDDLESIV